MGSTGAHRVVDQDDHLFGCRGHSTVAFPRSSANSIAWDFTASVLGEAPCVSPCAADADHRGHIDTVPARPGLGPAKSPPKRSPTSPPATAHAAADELHSRSQLTPLRSTREPAELVQFAAPSPRRQTQNTGSNCRCRIVGVELSGSNCRGRIGVELSGSNCRCRIVGVELSVSNCRCRIVGVELSGSNCRGRIVGDCWRPAPPQPTLDGTFQPGDRGVAEGYEPLVTGPVGLVGGRFDTGHGRERP